MTQGTERPWEYIDDPLYFRRVINDTRRLYLELRSEALVQFALSSDANAPDYLIVGSDGFRRECSGRSGREPNFERLSPIKITVAELRMMYRSAKLQKSNAAALSAEPKGDRK